MPRLADAGRPATSSAAQAARRESSHDRIRRTGERIGPYLIETRALADLRDLRADWEALAQTALERNVFLEPGFLLHAAQHLTEARLARAILIWREEGDAPRLVGLFPVTLPRLPFAPGEARGFTSVYGASGVPLVAAREAEEVISHYLQHLAGRGARHAGALFPLVPREGAFATALMNVARRSGRTISEFGCHERAVLRAGTATALNAKKAKELKRQLRRLAEQGEVRFERVRTSAAVRAAVEDFLSLEARGWKGQRGSAMMQDAGAAAFARSMTRDLARQGRCRVDLMKVGERIIAAGIVLEAGGISSFWKIAYDEEFAAFSPGVQLTLELSRRQAARKTVTLTDSCAVAGHPMIDRVWHERASVCDLMVATRTTPSAAASAIVLRENTRRRLRAVAKSAYLQITKGLAR
jgi:CelD/BcsL family acetyltransferase involved in cellulose biosynthesis